MEIEIQTITKRTAVIEPIVGCSEARISGIITKGLALVRCSSPEAVEWGFITDFSGNVVAKITKVIFDAENKPQNGII